MNRQTQKFSSADTVTSVIVQLRNKVNQGGDLSEVEEHLSRSLDSLERSLFAPSLMSVGGNVAGSLVKPVFFAALFLCALILPEKNSVALISAGVDAMDSGELASAFFVDHHTDDFDVRTAKVEDSDWISTAEVKLPILRTILAEEKAPPPLPVQAEAVPAALKEDLKTEAAIAGSLKAPAPSSGDRRSLVKFISGLIAAFRPTLPDSGLIARHIVELSGTEHIDPLYVASVIAIESRFSSTARSGVGATGLMQLMPMTAGEVAEKHNIYRGASRLTDPRTNIQLGIRYLKELEAKYKGNRFLALSAYNWGPANVDNAGRRENNIPGSVRKYSRTIIERTNNWRKHFTRANESADLLAEVPQQTPPTQS